MALVENILSLENEADSIVAQARAEAQALEPGLLSRRLPSRFFREMGIFFGSGASGLIANCQPR